MRSKFHYFRPELTLLEGRCLPAACFVPGCLDSTFGDEGKSFLGSITVDQANDVVIAPDGRLILVGSSETDVGLLIYSATGARDRSVQTFDFGGSEGATAAALQTVGGNTYLVVA